MVKRDVFYGLKAYFRDAPYTLISWCLLVTVPFFAYGIRICERPLASVLGYNLDNYITSIWWTVVTMTTIGYGDYYPYTLCGRIWTMVLFMWGALIVTLMIVALSESCELSISEEKSYNMKIKMSAFDQMKDEASKLVGNWWRLYKEFEAYSKLENPGFRNKWHYFHRTRRFRNTFSSFRDSKSNYYQNESNFGIQEFMVVGNAS